MMTTLQTGDGCQINDPNNLFPIALESLRFPLDSSMRIVFTGYFNGYNVEVKSADEITLLYHMGCFGKGSSSRSKPKDSANGRLSIMRKRQFMKRSYWHKKFAISKQNRESDCFLKDLEELTCEIKRNGKKQTNKDIIDLVSSDEDEDDVGEECEDTFQETMNETTDHDIVVIVPDSDSEDDNYFTNLKPKCCVNKIEIQEKLILSLQEAFFLSYGIGCLQIVDNDHRLLNVDDIWKLFNENEKNFCDKYIVYHYYKSKGYIVKPGIKFGGDYLLYKEGPGISHADYIVVLKSENEAISPDWITILGHVRVATSTVKEILIAEVVKPRNPTKLPEDLSSYSIREISISRKIPVTLSEGID